MTPGHIKGFIGSNSHNSGKVLTCLLTLVYPLKTIQ